jgi:hypothetical protein
VLDFGLRVQTRSSSPPLRPRSFARPLLASRFGPRYPIDSPEVVWVVDNQFKCVQCCSLQSAFSQTRSLTHSWRLAELRSILTAIRTVTSAPQSWGTSGAVSSTSCNWFARPYANTEVNASVHPAMVTDLLPRSWSAYAAVLNTQAVCITLQSMIASCKVCPSSSSPVRGLGINWSGRLADLPLRSVLAPGPCLRVEERAVSHHLLSSYRVYTRNIELM